MGLSVERRGDGPALVRLDGPLDYPATEELDEALAALVDGGVHRVAIDLTRAVPLDDAAVGVLYDTLRRVRAAGGAVALAVVDPRLSQVLSVMGLDRAFRMAATAEDALLLLGAVPAPAPGPAAGSGEVAGALVDWPAEGR
jgi:anti-anti-sigma factor